MFKRIVLKNAFEMEGDVWWKFWESFFFQNESEHLKNAFERVNYVRWKLKWKKKFRSVWVGLIM